MDIHPLNAASISAFKSRHGWQDLPHDYLVAMAVCLQSAANTAAIMDTCERLTIFPEPLSTLVRLEMASNPVAATADLLAARANTLAEQSDFDNAHSAFQAALLLQPRHLPTWISVATLAFSMGDCVTATLWARRVLEFTPRHTSDDPCEQLNAAIIRQSGQALAPNVLGAGPLWPDQDIRAFMAHIREACAGSTG